MLDTKGLEGAVRRGGSAGAEWGAALPVTAAPRGEPGLRAGVSGGAGGCRGVCGHGQGQGPAEGCVDMDRFRGRGLRRRDLGADGGSADLGA